MLSKLSFKNRRSGKVKRAAFYLRWARQIRRKRVAWARARLDFTHRMADRQREKMQHLAHVYEVPMDPMAPLPVIPALPGRAWVEHLQAMGELRDPVIAPAASIEARA